MKYPAYTEYKPSGVEWLGNIPAHWEVKLLKRFSTIRYGLGQPPPEVPDGVPLVRATNLKGGKITSDGMIYIDPADVPAAREAFLKQGEIIVVRSGAYTGDSALVPKEYAVSVAGYDMVVNVRQGFRPYFAWQIYSPMVRDLQFRFESLRAAQPHLNAEELKAIITVVPRLDEQRAIASFLDRETVRLDALILKKERLIELLQEKRAALIRQAVTRGLDPNVKMKDSGAEWLGGIPSHWKVMRIGGIAKSLQTGPFGSQLHSDEYLEGGIPVINPSHLRNGRIIADPSIAVNQETWLRLARHELLEGDIVVARRGEMGRCAMVTALETGWLCGSGSMRLRPDAEIAYPPFLNQVLCTKGVADWLLLESVGTTMDNLNTKIVGGIPVAVPPLKEQRAIAAYIDRETAKIDALVEKVRRAIETLKEYRTALISAAVTGKIDVRGL